MKKKLVTTLLMSAMVIGLLFGCGDSSTSENATGTVSQVDNPEESAKETTEEPKELSETEETGEEEANEYYEQGRAWLYGLDGKEMNLEEAYGNFEKAKELGKEDAGFYLGVLCYRYDYPKQDYELAKSYYEENGENPYAQIELASMYCYRCDEWYW